VRRIAVLDAPSNLGLRPPTATSVPGCAKAPGALRDHGLLGRLAARDAGCLTPPRYDPGDWRPGDGVAHAAQIAAYSRALADRIGAILDAGEFPVVLGGDCSILLGSGLAMHRLGAAVGGRIGLVFVDGHSDFRHPGNASYVGAAAGEDLALVTGRGQADLAAIEGRRPYFRDIDVVVLGIRAQDEYRLDLQAAGIVTRPVPALRAEGAARSAQWARDQLVDCAGYWLHVDVDVLDPAVLPAVDAPSPGGIAFPELELLLAGLVESPHCLGVEITVFDPDYDPDGAYAAEITSTVAAGLAAARTVTPRPDLVAARADLTSTPRRRAAPAAPGDEQEPSTGPEAPTASTPVPPSPADPVSSGLAAVRARAAELSPVETTGLAGAPDPGVTGLAGFAGPGDPIGAEEAAGPEDAATPEPATAGELTVGELTVGELTAGELTVGELTAGELTAGGPTAGTVGAEETAESPPDTDELGETSGEPVRLVSRPLGQAPLLDSEPLPATRPGMLRPRSTDDHAESFSLPAQRPAFDLGSGEPADIV
jgi:arginase